MDWTKEIAVMAFVKSELAKADRQKLWPYSLPQPAAQRQQVAETERELGFELDSSYKEFLLHADGWPAFYQSVDLFGTTELLGGPLMKHARTMLQQIESSVFLSSMLSKDHLLPIAATLQDLDLFVITTSSSMNPGEVIWFAGGEVQRFESFKEFFLSMEDYNRRELETLSGQQSR